MQEYPTELIDEAEEDNTGKGTKTGLIWALFFYRKKFQTRLDKIRKHYIINYKENLINNKEVLKILTIQQKINMACSAAEISKTELGKRIGLSQSAFSQRLKTGKFSDEDFQNIAKAIGAKYYSGFEFPDGTKIE